MKNMRAATSCLGLLLLAGCASDGERVAPIEARDVRRQVATVSGNSTRTAPAGTEVAVMPTSPDAPKVMALPDADRAASSPCRYFDRRVSTFDSQRRVTPHDKLLRNKIIITHSNHCHSAIHMQCLARNITCLAAS